MPTANGVNANHHVYVIPGVVDPDVVAKQARMNMEKKGETTYVHHHPKHVNGDNGEEIPTLVNCLGRHHDHYVPSVTTPSA